jgi:hypothetical protein
VHADVLRHDFSDWSALPDFPAGGRRGGIAAGAEAGWNSTFYYGTGSDNIQRYRDWWKLEFPVGIPTTEVPEFTIAPVPADAALRVASTGADWTI